MRKTTISKTRDEAGERIWWTNALLFVTVHLAAFGGIYLYPLRTTCKSTLVLSFILWQVACFSVTIGYHRLYAHKSFTASFGTRAVLALLGTSAFQGSIKWWVLRHRLHHVRSPANHQWYAATRGLVWSHIGWIFYKQHYARLYLIEKEDLEDDPVVRFQHEHYIPLAVLTSFVVPALIGNLWGDALGAFIWGGLVIAFAFSLAHWDGLQPYTDENTSRGNLITALLTCGEGNHNFHAFPHDFRSGPSSFDWDPSKWIILLLQHFGLASSLRRAPDADLLHARQQMQLKAHHMGADRTNVPADPSVPVMTAAQVCEYVKCNKDACVLIVDDNIVNVAGYLEDHPGGASILRKYSLTVPLTETTDEREAVFSVKQKATPAFHGGMNNHSRIAWGKLQEYTIAQLCDSE
ncbi:hypothetical protein PHLGIDRAFT_100083 [Phlebiopsis gigantea 11061_1 CR5-6]|uniref:Acyl-CoA desaturase n=1 Tax=Phlebiopsis gigantea (strain 11061_1 CR5-6) TaxID=745531 RepID=A0A0C3P074_PHLG1|nr:hypothetical protein PHLGIDRAFT_100083 [Phlebiopsis gigantea 11061_1 CR5-6]